MKFLRYLLFFYLTFLVTPGFTDPANKESIPLDVNNLSADWWEYFEVPPETFNQHIQTFQSNMEEVTKNLSPEAKTNADNLIEKIVLKLKTYEQNLNKTIPSPPQATPFSNEYSIDDVVELYQTISKLSIELKNEEVELDDKRLQLQNGRELLEKTKGTYAKADSRSEAKLLSGLEIINLRSNIEVLLQSIEFLDKAIQARKEGIKHLQDELNYATKKISSSDLDIFLYAKKAKTNEETLNETITKVKQMQSLETAALSKAVGGEKDENYQKLVQETDQEEIKEAIAYNQYLFALLQFHLASLTQNPEEVDTYELELNIDSWKKNLFSYQTKITEWKNQSERQLQITGQLLSKDEKEEQLNVNQQQILELAQQNLVFIQRLENEFSSTKFLLNLLDAKLSELVGGGRRYLQYAGELFKRGYNNTIYWLTRELYTVGKNRVTVLSVLEFFVIIIVTVWLSRIILATLTRFAHQRKGIKKSLVYRVTRLFYYLLLAIGIIVALSALGFDFSNLVLIASALGVGIGFGLQSIFNNFISGLIILFESHLKVGDYIELESGLKGEIREINVRSTLITDNDGIDVLVPNAEIISNKVLNWTLKVPYRRFHIPFTVAYGSDKDLIAKIVVEAAKKVPHTLHKLGIPEPMVRLDKLGESGLQFELVVWVTEKYTKRTRRTRSDYLWAIESTLTKHEISIPYPQRDIHITNNK